MMVTEHKQRLQGIMIFLLVILSLNFFFARFVSTSMLKNVCYAYMLGAVMLSIPRSFKIGNGFVLPVQMISISVLLSIFLAQISWKQDLTYFTSTIPYLLWIVFFYLLHIRFPIAKLEKITFFYGWVYILLFMYQYTHSHVVYFGFKEEFAEDRGVIRILFPGAGVFLLAYYIALNKVMDKTKYRWIFALFILCGIAVTVLQVTKQSIAILLLITLFHLLRTVSVGKKVLVMILAGAAIYGTLNSNNPISRGIIESQRDNVQQGNQNIRILASEYFVNDFSPNLLSRIFGNGYPNLKSNYGKFITILEDNYGYFLTDVGVVGMYVMFGILPIIAYVIIFYKGLRMQVPPEYQYLKYYLFNLLATCLTSDSIFSISFILTNVFVLYSLQVLYEEKQSTTLMKV